MDKKPNYSPPGWLVYRLEVCLQPEIARQFQEMRERLCAHIDTPDHTNYPFLHTDALFERALELLLQQELELSAKIKEMS